MTSRSSLPPAYFDDVYAASADPWQFETSPYEAAKYAATIGALGERRFASAYEIGCSIGVLTAQLASRCDALLAVDVSEAALAQARARCSALPQVRLEQMRVPAEFPVSRFDLVVTSEVAYYWSRPDLQHAAEQIEAALLPGGLWLLVHWTPAVADYPLGGDEVHEFVLRRSGPEGSLRHVTGLREATYRLDVFARPGDAHVAR